jgi:putative flippase GtrA
VTDEFVATAPLPFAARVRAGLCSGRNWLQLVRFAAVGAGGYAVNLVTFALAVRSLHYVAASVVAFGLAVTNNFVWNRRWTFRVRHGRRHHQALRFLIISVGAFGVSLAVLGALVELAGMAEVPAQAIAVVAGLPVNFLGQKLWSFAT